MGVHVLSSNLAQQGGLFEPQRTFNWTIEIGGFATFGDMDMVTLSLVSMNLPDGSNEEISIPYGNDNVWVPGKASWAPIPIRFRDWIDRPVALALSRWRRAVYDPITGAIGLARDIKRQATVTLFGPDSVEGAPTYPRSHKLIGLWPSQGNFGALDQTSSDAVYIEMTLRYDKALPLSTSTLFPVPGGTLAPAAV